MDFTYPNDVGFECSGCGLCCGDTSKKTRRILLLESEANEIAGKTGKPIEEFAQPVEGKEPYFFEMKKTSEGKCVFLENNRCRIYAYRGLICRFYPFELKFDVDKNTHVFGFTCECPQINRGKIMGKKDFEELYSLAEKRLP